MGKRIFFLFNVGIIVLVVLGLFACGKATPSVEPQVSPSQPPPTSPQPSPASPQPAPSSPQPSTSPPQLPISSTTLSPVVTRVVLAEMFSADWWTYCPSAARAIERLAKELSPEKLLVLQYHSGDKNATTETQDRAKEYRVQGFPSMFFNGGNNVLGGGSGIYEKYSAAVSKELTKQSPVSIAGSMTSSGGVISIEATVTNVSNSPVASAKLMAVVYEDMGTDEHRYVVRDILAPLAIASLSAGGSDKFSLSSDFRGSSSSMKAVLFLQSSSSEVLQSALATAK